MNQNEELENLIAEHRSIMLAKNHLFRLEIRLKQEKENLIKLEEILEKEYQDLERFKDTPVNKLFHKILKSREEQYEIEKQEYLHAVLQFKDSKNIIELLEFEKGVLIEKISKEKVIKQQLSSLISQRDFLVNDRYIGFKNTMIGLHQQMDQKLSYKREIHEALIVGLKVTDVFNKMIHLLKLAQAEEGWGMKNFHVGRLNEGQKNYVDQVFKLSYKAKQLLMELEDEMDDVYEHKSIKRLNRIEEFKYFTDVYYERLISDWIVKNRIISALNYLHGTADSVTRIVETLKIQLKVTEKAIAYLNERKQSVIDENTKKE